MSFISDYSEKKYFTKKSQFRNVDKSEKWHGPKI